MGDLLRAEIDTTAKSGATDGVFELKDVTVQEVSLVDHPAIGREILLTKRATISEEGKMTTKTTKAEPKAIDEEKSEEAQAEEAPVEEIQKPKVEKAAGGELAPEAEPVVPDANTEAFAALTPVATTKIAQFHLEALQRHVGEPTEKASEDVTSFSDRLSAYLQWDAIYASLDAVSSTIFDIIYGADDGDKQGMVKTTIGEFETALLTALDGLGMKATKTEENTDEESNAVKTLQAILALTERVDTLATRIEDVAQAKRDDTEVVHVPDEVEKKVTMSASELLKLIDGKIAAARKPLYKSTSIVEDDLSTDTADEADAKESDQVAALRTTPGLVHAGLSGMTGELRDHR